MLKQSEIIIVVVLENMDEIAFYPNPIRQGDFINVENADVNMLLKIYDMSGRLVKERMLENNVQLSTDEMFVGNYFYQILNTKNNQLLSDGKFIVF